MTDKPKSCPLCNCEDIGIVRVNKSGRAVACKNCGVQTSAFYGKCTDWSQERAIAIWQTRATDQMIGNLAEALEKLSTYIGSRGMDLDCKDCSVLMDDAERAVKAYKETL